MRLHKTSSLLTGLLLLGGVAALAQGPQARQQAQPMAQPMRPGRPPMERTMDRWWNNPEMVEKLAVTPEQKKKIEDVFQQNRLKLIDLSASLQKAEVTLEPLMNADQPDEAKILAGIDRVAQARAELEKGNARMLLGIRQVLTPEQWKKLHEMHHGPQAGMPGMGPRPAAGFRGRQGQGQGRGPQGPPPAQPQPQPQQE